MEAPVNIRLYKPEDRPAIRGIFHETADCGNPGDSLFQDKELAADFWTLYYTDYEPESLWVAEDQGKLVGYLAGCFDDRKFRRRRFFPVGPLLFWRGLWRGSFFRWWLWRFLFFNVPRWVLEKPHRSFLRGNYAAHLHINLMAGTRGKGIGKKLMEQFLANAGRFGSRGIHVEVREDNAGGRLFFEKFGFKVLGRRFGFRVAGPPPKDYFVIVYGKELL